MAQGGDEIETPDSEKAPATRHAPLHMVRLEQFEEAIALSQDERTAYRRRFVTLFADDSHVRRGGFGRVTRVTNALGETLALKTLITPQRDELEQEDRYAARVDRLKKSFRREYEDHRALSGLRGFPRLYGYGLANGVPAIVMEWVEGMTLEAVRRRLSVDDAGRMSPLDAARIGSALFDLLANMDLIGGGFVHRDISPANIMVRTARLPIEQQAEEGSFDLCLIDFGSAALLDPSEHTSFTVQGGSLRMATAAYAPPEMLTQDLPHIERLRKSPAIDVYEAASVVYELVCGYPPFCIASQESRGTAGQPREGQKNASAKNPAKAGAPTDTSSGSSPSPFRIKIDQKPRPIQCVHGACRLESLADVLVKEPEIALAAGKAALDLQLKPTSPQVKGALEMVDEQLAELLMPCFATAQHKRPTAQAIYDGLDAFCAHYTQNIGRAMRGEALIPCTGSSSWLDATSPFALRRLVRTVGKAVAAAVFVVVVVATALLLDGASATFVAGPIAWQGSVSGVAVAAMLVVPALCAYAARGKRAGTLAGFARGTLMLLCVSGLVAVAMSCLHLEQPERTRGLLAALLAAESAAWCPIVLDFAMTVVPSLIAEARRRLASGAAGAIGASEEEPRLPDGDGVGAVESGASEMKDAEAGDAVPQEPVEPHPDMEGDDPRE